MACLFLRGGRENWRVQFGGVDIACAQRNATDFAALLVAFPAGTCQITAHNAFHGKHFQLADDHRTAFQIRRVFAQDFRIFRHIRRNEMVRQAFENLEPVQRDLRQHCAFAGDAVGHDAVKRADAVCRDEQQRIPQVIDVTDFAALRFADFWNFGTQKGMVFVVFHCFSPVVTMCIAPTRAKNKMYNVMHNL